MRILLTNDDGIYAPGLKVLEEIAAEFSDDIWVCAPDDEQSGAGHSLTLTRPVRLRRHGEKRFSVVGTPTDAVMMGLRKAMDGKVPDLILSGVNRGANLADDITYSGTVSAAIEGALAGIPAIALSQVLTSASLKFSDPFAAARKWGAKVIAPLLNMQMAKRTLINVNFPPIPAADVRGIRAVRQGFHDYSRGSIVEGRDPRGYKYYWFTLEEITHSLDHGTDLEAIEEGYVAITPLQLDLTHHSALGALADQFSSSSA